MLIAALLTPRTGTALEAVRPLGEVVWSRVREPGSGNPRQEFGELARTAADVILLDADAAPADVLMAGVRQLRLLHRGRVLVLAPGAQPGHRGIDLLVGLGVYDIIAPQEQEPDWAALIGQVLSGPAPTYAHAARWHVSAAPPEPAAGGGGDSQGGGRERIRVVRQVERIVERVPLAGRPVVVAVAAVAPGLGATFTAMAAAGHLTRQGHRVAVVEASARPSLAAMLAAMGHPPADPGGVEIVPGVTVHAQPAYAPAAAPPGWNSREEGLRLARGLLAVGRERHEYLVLDLGAVGPDDIELARADLGVIVVGAAPWRLLDLHQWFANATAAANASMPHWRYVQTPAERADPALEMAAGELGTRAVALPWIQPGPVPGYQGISDAASAALGALLEPVLLRPGEVPRRRGRLFGRSARRTAQRVARGAVGAAGTVVFLVVDGALGVVDAAAAVGRWLLGQWFLILVLVAMLAVLAGAGVSLGPLTPAATWVLDAGRKIVGWFL